MFCPPLRPGGPHDLGSGLGMAVVGAAALFNLNKAVGIELSARRHGTAKRILTQASSVLQGWVFFTRLTRGARLALADFQRTSDAYTWANDPTAHAGRSQYNARAVVTKATPPRHWSYTRVIQPVVATKGAATVNRAKV